MYGKLILLESSARGSPIKGMKPILTCCHLFVHWRSSQVECIGPSSYLTKKGLWTAMPTGHFEEMAFDKVGFWVNNFYSKENQQTLTSLIEVKAGITWLVSVAENSQLLGLFKVPNKDIEDAWNIITKKIHVVNRSSLRYTTNNIHDIFLSFFFICFLIPTLNCFRLRSWLDSRCQFRWLAV